MDELESAAWFTRREVADALARTEADPYFKELRSKDVDSKNPLRYIPPRGAIAHQIIKQWIMNK